MIVCRCKFSKTQPCNSIIDWNRALKNTTQVTLLIRFPCNSQRLSQLHRKSWLLNERLKLHEQYTCRPMHQIGQCNQILIMVWTTRCIRSCHINNSMKTTLANHFCKFIHGLWIYVYSQLQPLPFSSSCCYASMLW